MTLGSIFEIKRKCFILHGFNIKDGGEKTTDKLVALVREMGYEPIQFDYGWLGLLGARIFSDNIAHLLTNLSSNGDIAIGHSNGCNIINKAIRYGAQFERLLYVSPALDNNTELGAQVLECTVLHTKRDWVVQLASILPWHPWGNMGRVGYRGEDNRYKNIDCTNWAAGHSDYFSEQNLGRLCYFTIRALDEKGISDYSRFPGAEWLR